MSPVRQVFQYYWQFIKPYKLAYFSVYIVMTFRMFFGTLVAGYVYKLMIDVIGNEMISISERYNLALLFLIPLMLSYFSGLLMGRYAEWVNFRFLAHTLQDMYEFSFRKLTLHSYGFYSNTFTGSLVAKTKRFVNSFDKTFGNMAFNFWPTIVVVTGSVIALSLQSKKIALFFLAWCVFYTIIIFFFVRKKVLIDLERAAADTKITGALADSITNMSNIKTFSSSDKEFNRFQEVVFFLRSRLSRAWNFTIGRHAFQSFVMFAFEVLSIFISIKLWKSGEITLGVFVMVYAYLHTITNRIWDLSSGLTNFIEDTTNAKEMVDILETEIEVKDPKNPETPIIKNGLVEFKDIYFSYIDGVNVFEKFNLTVQPGEKIGLVGHSGSGKSTITKLLLRFVDVDKGELLIDGQNIANITQNDLRAHISYVPQDPILFHRSIKENISYSKNDATNEEIINAAKKAHAHGFVESLQNGYDTLVGERGVKLSGGERQRVAIARAMLKQAPILVLDEATSSLDSISESHIQDAFDELMKNKTTIVIAHRLSTIQKMDRIIVLDQGKIVEEGNHKDLLARDGFYAELWNRQTGGFLEE